MRYITEIQEGLSEEQVQSRIRENRTNHDTSIPSRSVGTIIRENVCTLFNLVNAILALAILSVGSYKNMLFMGVVISNLCIGIVQEIRAKRAVDRLSLLHTAHATVIRSGREQSIPIDRIVLDDILLLQTGNQAAVDCIVLHGSCLVDESFITGEADAISKKPGDTILSGSIVLSGACHTRADRIGEDTYISEISRGAKYYKKTKSEIMTTLNRIIGVISVIIFPVGLILLHNQLSMPSNTFTDAVVHTVAALIGMIPEGLILLTSTVLAVSVVRLSARQVLVQDLYCIESLARVDTLCLDKTGTLTTGEMLLDRMIPYGDHPVSLQTILQNIAAASPDSNATIMAIRKAVPPQAQWTATHTVPFSSATKWSAVSFAEQGTYFMGAAEYLYPQGDAAFRNTVEQYSAQGRVLLLAWSADAVQDDALPDRIIPVGFLLLKDHLRPSVQQTLQYFHDEAVTLKVISGDSALTVSRIARDAGVPDWQNAVDLSTVSDEELPQVAKTCTVFGRVRPDQKKKLVQAMQEQGHTVAMTGDGVNDVLALKQADCSIAMAAGTDAARNVSQLVLLNSDFDSLPSILGEGRRSINNIQRSASLFLVKTIYATLFALLFLFIRSPYPFVPIQLTLISCITIGVPSFLLALEPNFDRVRGRFLLNILRNALPGGLTIVSNLILLMLASEFCTFSYEEFSTLCVLLTGFSGFLVLHRVCTPFNRKRLAMYVLLAVAFVTAIVLLPGLFSLVALPGQAIRILLLFIPLDILIFRLLFGMVQHLSPV